MKEAIWAFSKLFSFLFFLIKQRSYKRKSKNVGLRTCMEIPLITVLSLSLKIFSMENRKVGSCAKPLNTPMLNSRSLKVALLEVWM